MAHPHDDFRLGCRGVSYQFLKQMILYLCLDASLHVLPLHADGPQEVCDCKGILRLLGGGSILVLEDRDAVLVALAKD